MVESKFHPNAKLFSLKNVLSLFFGRDKTTRLKEKSFLLVIVAVVEKAAKHFHLLCSFTPEVFLGSFCVLGALFGVFESFMGSFPCKNSCGRPSSCHSTGMETPIHQSTDLHPQTERTFLIR